MKDPFRRVDAESLRGLAHPLRVRILSLLRLDGPATSTGLAKRLGETSGTTSWHLRHLARHGFIEEDRERGNLRERWWRARHQLTVVDRGEFLADPQLREQLAAFSTGVVEHQFRRAAAFLTQDWPDAWQRAANMSDWHLRLTPDRAAALRDELAAVVARYDGDTDGDEVLVQIQGFPYRPAAAR